jgi:hypothetical protein
VVDAQFDPPQRLRVRSCLQQPLDPQVHMLPVAQNLIQPRPCKYRPQPLFRKRRKPLVIAVEQPGKIRIEQPVVRQELAQNKRLEEPGRMRQVPLGRRGLRVPRTPGRSLCSICIPPNGFFPRTLTHASIQWSNVSGRL